MQAIVGLALLWWILTDGVLYSWAVGLPAIFLCAWLAARLQTSAEPEQTELENAGGGPAVSKAQIQWRYLPLFTAHFISRSVLAGFDVGKRTLSPRMPLNPGFIDYQSKLPDGAARLFFISVVSLLPGTLSSKIIDNGVRLHVLDTEQDIANDCVVTEQAIARLFGVKLASANELEDEAPKSEAIKSEATGEKS